MQEASEKSETSCIFYNPLEREEADRRGIPVGLSMKKSLC